MSSGSSGFTNSTTARCPRPPRSCVGHACEAKKSAAILAILVPQGISASNFAPEGASTRIVDRTSGEIHYGKVPEYSVVVPGTMPSKNNPEGPALYCVVIVKKVDEKTRSKTSINDLLRD